MCLFIETLRIEDGKVWHASLHDRRMNDTRRAFFGPVPDLHVMDYLRPEAHTARTRCRLTYARDVIRVEYFPYHVRPVHSLQLVVQDDIDYRYKQADRHVLDKAFALREQPTTCSLCATDSSPIPPSLTLPSGTDANGTPPHSLCWPEPSADTCSTPDR